MKLTINLNDELHKRLKIKAATDQTTITELILKGLSNIGIK